MSHRIGRLISILYRKSQIFLGQALKDYNITCAEYPILLCLNQKDGVTQEELAAQLYMDKSAIARVIQDLVTKGFVKKSKDEIDQRCNRIYLTQQGCKMQPHIVDALNDWNTILMLDLKEEQQEEIYNLLLHMVTNVKNKS